MQNQINYLAAILTAGLSQKTIPGTDFSKADWNVLMPFIDANHLYSITEKAFRVYKDKSVGQPPRDVFMKCFQENIKRVGDNMKHATEMRQISKEWKAKGRCLLALGGEALSVYYPNLQMRGGSKFVCIPLHQKEQEADAQPGTQDGFEIESNAAETLTSDNLTLTIPVSAVGPFGGRRGDEADAILRSAFHSAPFTMKAGLGIAYPAPVFLALHHLFTAQQLLLNDVQLPFDMLVDWAMMLRTFGSNDSEPFDWSDFLEKAGNLGILPFVQSFTALAVRLTGITLPEGAASLTAADEDVDYLLKCIFESSSATDAAEGRFSRFVGALRNSKKYDRFSDSSSIREAFYHLFK